MYKSLKDSNLKLNVLPPQSDIGGGSGNSNEYDFGINTEVIGDLIEKIDEAITKLGEEGTGGALDKIYNDIYGLEGEDSWQGESYDLFKEKCDSYKESIYAVVDLLEAFKDKLDETEPLAEELIEEVSSSLEIS